MLCRTADRGSGSKTFKESILDKCNERNDEWAGQVRVVATMLTACPNS